MLNFSGLMSDLDKLVSDIKMTVLATCVDKISLCKNSPNPINPYFLSLDFIFEALLKKAIPGENFVVVLEQRGKKEDHELLSHIRQIITTGTEKIDSALLQRIKGVYFNPKWTDDYQWSYCGLEIADLCAYSIYKEFTSENGYTSFNIVKKHFLGYPDYLGSGLKFFP